MKQAIRATLLLIGLYTLCYSCQKEKVKTDIINSNSLYTLKTYTVERHPTVLRNGFGMDMYHDTITSYDTAYLKPDNNSFAYDLKFYNEYVYVLLSTGDYSYSGYPVIFMYTDTTDDSKSVKAAMIGQGPDCFEAFSYDSISHYIHHLRSDPYINLDQFRTKVHTKSADGSILLRDSIAQLFTSLVIGNKFRPDIGGIISGVTSDDANQIYQQPVFLVRTREGRYAKFMVTRFKGVGPDAQRCFLQWNNLR